MRRLTSDPILKSQIGWWLERDGSGRVVNLIRPGAYDGTLQSGVTWTDSPYGQSMLFDGSSYVDLGAAPLIDRSVPFTLMWLERTDTSSGARGLFCFSPAGVSGQRFVVFRYDTTGTSYNYLACCECNIGSGLVPRFATAPSLASGVGKWKVWILTGTAGMIFQGINYTNYQLMVDGVSYTATGGNTLGSNSGTANYIGWDSLDSKWLGALRNVRFWGRALSTEEKLRLTINPEAGLVRVRERTTQTLMTSSRLDRMFIAM